MVRPDEIALDLMFKILVADPNLRITSSEALNHPFFDSVRKSTPPVCHIFQNFILCFNQNCNFGGENRCFKIVFFGGKCVAKI